jgi:ATP-dependent Clp protease protease subunit
MQTIIKSVNGYQVVPVDALLNAHRAIYISGEINDELAMNVMKQVTYLAHEDSTESIRMYINSCGGAIDAGMVIYDILQACPAPIQVYCTGKAYSMAAVLLCCGQHGRYILPHSKVMIHEPLISTGVGGKTSSIQTIAESMMKTKEEMVAILAKHTGQPLEKLYEVTKTDTFFSADEAVAFGLADKVVDFAEMVK